MNSSAKQQFLEGYDAYADSLYRFIFFKVRHNHELAEDILQQTFCNAWKKLEEKGALEHLQAYLYQIARNLVIDHIKKASTQREIQIDESHDVSDEHLTPIIDLLDHQLALEVAKNLITSLPDNYLEIIQLRFIEDKTIDEIAELLSISHNNVSLRIHRALKSLKQHYEQELQTT